MITVVIIIIALTKIRGWRVRKVIIVIVAAIILIHK